MSAELRNRLLVAFWGIPTVLAAAYFGDWFFALLIALISAVGAREVMKLIHSNIPRPFMLAGVCAAALMPLSMHHFGAVVLLPFLLGLILVTGFLSVLESSGQDSRNPIAVLAASMLFVIPMTTVVLMRDFPIWTSKFQGAWGIIYIWGGIWITDSSAYLFGKKFGRKKIAPEISPGKTYEGTFAGVLAAIIWALVAGWTFQPVFTIPDRLAIGLIIGVFSFLGDLIASRLKRFAGVKDSGTVFPGHGGVYDRFDSLVMTFPGVYLYIVLAGMGAL